MQQNNLTLQNQLFETNKIEEENYTFIESDGRMYGIKTCNVLEILKIMELDYSNFVNDAKLILSYKNPHAIAMYFQSGKLTLQNCLNISLRKLNLSESRAYPYGKI